MKEDWSTGARSTGALSSLHSDGVAALAEPPGPTLVAVQDRPRPAAADRPRVAGKFIEVGGEKLLLRGVTYGTFRPDGEGFPYPERGRVQQDFAAMAEIGINAVRLYTVPPEWLLDSAAEHGLRALIGLSWEDHVAVLERRDAVRSVVARVRDGVRACAGHPAVLAYSVGSEIPAAIARWHGRVKVERFIERLYHTAKSEDPEALVTYVNYPTTEYLQLPFLDVSCFNVFLEDERALTAYVGRLHRLAGQRPLLLAEVGLDSRQHGQDRQAQVLDWQISTAFEGGCAGTFVFSWTDEWHRGGYEIEDWEFGLVDRQRRPKPALAAVGRAFDRLWQADRSWPRFSVVVCTHNGARTLPECLDAVTALDYPDYEVIVVDDGSTDESGEIAAARGARVIRCEENLGLSNARNIGAEHATGELIAYIDDDAHPDIHWLRLLAVGLSRGHAVVGGPNIPPADDGRLADGVADAPGGPVHVLASDDIAEHVPGCNMAVRKDLLNAVGGFDPQFRIAGDDVDLCWRMQRTGHSVGFSPAAMVWHHRRGSVRAYLRQQYRYGEAEAMLERKWPERYNRLGHITWSGHVYGESIRHHQSRRAKIGYGTWGTQLFQSIYEPHPSILFTLSVMPEWYLVAVMLAALTALGLAWTPLLLAFPLLVLLSGGIAASAMARETTRRRGARWTERLSHRTLVFGLTIVQPLARLAGRLHGGLSPWRRPGGRAFAVPRPRRQSIWSERWRPLEGWLETVEEGLLSGGNVVARGASTDRWDLQVRVGAFGAARLLSSVEEHGGGRQFVHFRSWPRCSPSAYVLAPLVGVVAIAAALSGAIVPTIVLGSVALLAAGVAAYDCSLANGILLLEIERLAPASLELNLLDARVRTEAPSSAGAAKHGPLPTPQQPPDPVPSLTVIRDKTASDHRADPGVRLDV